MTADLIIGLTGFAFVTSITPGPNNLMLMASGANFGLRRSVPHMLGIGAGFVLMIILVGLGLAQVFERTPVLKTILMVFSILYMLWLTWKIANAAAPAKADSTARPITFLQAAAFQWVNPKAWAMALTAITAYAGDQSLGAILVVACVFGAINLPCVSSWTVLGLQFRRLLGTPKRLKMYNWTMAALLIISMIPLISI